ncbi:MAG: hypothetical protein ACHQK8_00020 [Bacteroidia bacterium]
MKTTSIIFFIFGLSLCFNTCKKETTPDNSTNTSNGVSKSKITGKSQKGPFINGSTVTLYEVDPALNQTGKSFVGQILDNTGFFQLSSISLISSFAEFKADGFYFNEVTGNASVAPITLYAVTDLTAKSQVNINVLSHLEMQRVQFLLPSIGFAAAKVQARSEILNIFGITKPTIGEFETLDIADTTDDDAILLAISAILLGHRTESQLSQLLSDIITDIRTDGILNSSSTGTALINDAKYLDTAAIANNIRTRYASFGMTVSVPNFGKYIYQFINTSSYTFTNRIQYPVIYNGRINILSDSLPSSGNNGFDYTTSAFIPLGGKLRIVFKSTTGNYSDLPGFQVMPNPPKYWTLIQYTNADSCALEATGMNDYAEAITALTGQKYIVDIYENQNNPLMYRYKRKIIYP